MDVTILFKGNDRQRYGMIRRIEARKLVSDSTKFDPGLDHCLHHFVNFERFAILYLDFLVHTQKDNLEFRDCAVAAQFKAYLQDSERPPSDSGYCRTTMDMAGITTRLHR